MENIKYESIAGKNVVITGASGGIGEALTAMYNYNGANLILTDIVHLSNQDLYFQRATDFSFL